MVRLKSFYIIICLFIFPVSEGVADCYWDAISLSYMYYNSTYLSTSGNKKLIEAAQAKKERNARKKMNDFLLCYNRERYNKGELPYLPNLPKDVKKHIGMFVGVPQPELEEGLNKIRSIQEGRPIQESGNE